MLRRLHILSAFGSAGFAFFGLWVGAPKAMAVEEMGLTIGEGWCAVREVRELVLTNAEQDIVLTGLPTEVDLTTLAAQAQRRPISLIEWERVMSESDQVRCRIQTEELGARYVQLTYWMTGLTWKATYDVRLRGNMANEDEALAADLIGSVKIRNATGKSFDHAVVRLVASSSVGLPHAAPGFLMLEEDNPLSEPWRKPIAETPHTFSYALAQSVDLLPRNEVLVELVRSLRMPASRLYVLDMDAPVLTTKGAGLAFSKFILVKNDPSYGLGRALPPGSARIFLGGGRSSFIQEAQFEHMPVHGEIRIDLGKTERVRAVRRPLGKTEPVAGFHEESYEWTIENSLPGAAQLEIHEKPPTILEWDVIKANVPYSVQGRKITFATSVEDGNSFRLEYTIRVREPGI